MQTIDYQTLHFDVQRGIYILLIQFVTDTFKTAKIEIH